jgi:hypothetical protein
VPGGFTQQISITHSRPHDVEALGAWYEGT